jgi:hypothetical protein
MYIEYIPSFEPLKEILKVKLSFHRPDNRPSHSFGDVAAWTPPCPSSVAQGSLCTIVSETTVISLEVGSGSVRICSSLPHAETCVFVGPASLLLFFVLRSARLVKVCKPRLESGYDCPEGLPEELKSWERPIFLKPLRISGWMIGRLDTTTETNVSRQAHLEPAMAPSGPDCDKSVICSIFGSLFPYQAFIEWILRLLS